ncbi:MAG: hypothetical protein HYR94_14085 [Chloroflexi bacterium]|nr:hypothetical protein [Chloroflexota bacterium]
MLQQLKELFGVLIAFIVVLIMAVAILVWLIGATGFVIGLSVLGLLIYGFACFIAGVYVCDRSYKQGASIAIDSASRNDAHDAQKMDALAGLVEAVVKGYAQTQNSMLKTPQLPHFPYPELPDPNQKALRFDDAVFEELED